MGLPYVKIFTCLISCRLRVEGLRKCNMVMGDHIVIRRLIINQLVLWILGWGGGGVAMIRVGLTSFVNLE